MTPSQQDLVDTAMPSVCPTVLTPVREGRGSPTAEAARLVPISFLQVTVV